MWGYEGTTKNAAEALRLYRQAAALGFSDAQIRIGELRRRQTVEPLRKSPPRTSPATLFDSDFEKVRPQKWPGFTPPRSRKMPPLRGLLLHRRVQVQERPVSAKISLNPRHDLQRIQCPQRQISGALTPAAQTMSSAGMKVPLASLARGRARSPRTDIRRVRHGRAGRRPEDPSVVAHALRPCRALRF